MDKYVELLTFEMEVTNILQAKTYELNEEGYVPLIKKLVRQRGPPTFKTLTSTKREA